MQVLASRAKMNISLLVYCQAVFLEWWC